MRDLGNEVAILHLRQFMRDAGQCTNDPRHATRANSIISDGHKGCR